MLYLNIVVKEILESVIAAEAEAETAEREALDKSRRILADAENRAEKLKREAENSLKEEIKALFEKARADGEAQAAEMLKNAVRHNVSDADRAAAAKVAAYVEREFYKTLQ